MYTEEQLEKVKKWLIETENIYSKGSWCESEIKKDLENRKLSDKYSQTNTLSEKKKKYIEQFDKDEAVICNFTNNLQIIHQNHELISNCERCKIQISNLRNIVQNFS